MVDPARDERFRRCFADHSRAVLGYALRRTESPNDAADVLAETMLVAWRRLDELPEEPETRLWLYGVARHVVANVRRGNRRRARLAGKLRAQVTQAMLRLDPPEPRQADPRLISGLRELNDDEREVLLLTAAEGLTPHEIATVLGRNPNTVRTHLHRARLKLRTHLLADDAATSDGTTNGAKRPTPSGHVAHRETPSRPPTTQGTWR